MRVKDIKEVFNPIMFICMVRNPYAQAEGIIRRNKATPEYAAKFALKCLKYQKQNLLWFRIRTNTLFQKKVFLIK